MNPKAMRPAKRSVTVPEKSDAERRNEQAAFMLRNMLGTGVIDIPKVLGVLEERKPQLRLVEGTAA